MLWVILERKSFHFFSAGFKSIGFENRSSRGILIRDIYISIYSTLICIISDAARISLRHFCTLTLH